MMLCYNLCIFVILGYRIGGISAQASAEYVCVPAAYCINNGGGGGGGGGGGLIDPRIVTPRNLIQNESENMQKIRTGKKSSSRQRRDAVLQKKQSGKSKQKNGKNSIPKISRRQAQTDGSGVCPSGSVPCYGQGPSSRCGIRYINQANTGDGTAEYGVYPWQAYLEVTNGVGARVYAGSGVLIDNYHILTAAHKVVNYVNTPGNINVVMGLYNPGNRTGTQTSSVTRVVLNPGYQNATYTLRNDIAVLRVGTPFGLGVQPNVNTLCMPPSGTSFVGQSCVVAGWGQTQFTTNDAPTTPMKQVTVPVVDYNTCFNSYSQPNLLGTNAATYLDQNEVCAGGQTSRDACTQDGGAPLVCYNSGNQRYTVAGLVIWGKNCGQAGVYGVYVGIAPYRNWIDSTLINLNTLQG